MILGIVGGVNAGDTLEKTGVYTPPTLSKVGAALFMFTLILLIASTFITSFSISHAVSGERRILLAVALSLPFLLARIIYSAVSVFGHSSSFNVISGNNTILLCVALLPELGAVIIFLGFGITLEKPKYKAVGVGESAHLEGIVQVGPTPTAYHVNGGPGRRQGARKIVRHTLIGTLIAAIMSRGQGEDAEMQRFQG